MRSSALEPDSAKTRQVYNLFQLPVEQVYYFEGVVTQLVIKSLLFKLFVLTIKLINVHVIQYLNCIFLNSVLSQFIVYTLKPQTFVLLLHKS